MKQETDIVELLRNDSRLWGDTLVERAMDDIRSKRAALAQCAVELKEAANLLRPHYRSTAMLYELAAGVADEKSK